eukprot:gene245-348_t
MTDKLLHLSETADIFISSDFISNQFASRFQTGFFFLRRVQSIQEVFHFMNLESMANLEYMRSSASINKMFESDQHLFNKHIRCSKSSVELENGGSPSLPYIHSLKECRIIDIGYSGHAPPRQRILLMNISREVFNAFPSHPSPWGLMGLPLGDERNDSLIIHFAGVYGGISEENGRPNYLATLLAVKGFIDRHLRFLLSSQQLRSIDNGR